MKSNIALIGFMGCGKTSVGKILAKRLGKRYISTDLLIQKIVKKSIPRIFKENGEIKFRELEIRAIKKISKVKNAVIDCGGGVVLNFINIQRLKENSHIIYLKANPKVILKRIKKSKNRPLLFGKNKLEKIKELLQFRKPFYERAADYIIDTTRLNVKKIVEKIIDFVRKNEGKNLAK